jgi:DNA-binding NtrC family response regulator
MVFNRASLPSHQLTGQPLPTNNIARAGKLYQYRLALGDVKFAEHVRGSLNMPEAKILLIDHDAPWAQMLSDLLIHDGHEVFSSNLLPDALLLLRSHQFDLVIADINAPGYEGADFLEEVRLLSPYSSLMVYTARPRLEQAVEATKLGASDYCEKSRDVAALESLRVKVGEVLHKRAPSPAVEPLPRRIPTVPSEGFYGIISRDPHMHEIFELIQTIADSQANVLIHGETGTGKELIARAIHDASNRHAKPFVTLDCSTLARELLESELFGHEKGAFTGATDRHIGRFERANGGTLFLDEVANVSMPVQAKLLRVLQTRTFERVGGVKSISVDVRIIAASNRPLEQGVAEANFREDLYHRLNVVQIDLPALRNRAGDVPLLAMEFLRRFARQNGRDVRAITPAALQALATYRWPGNVRELENVILQAVVLAKTSQIDAADLPKRITQAPAGSLLPGPALADQLGEPEKQIVLNALRQHNGNIKRAAAMLDISRTTLYAKLKKYGIDPDAIR